MDRLLAARSFWKVSAMSLTYRLHRLHLLSDWQHRTKCMTLGYRSAEPGGIIPEPSQLLGRSCSDPRARSVSIRDAAHDLNLHREDIRDFIRDLAPIAA